MNYELYMNKCIELAKLGEGNVSPNPLVGCVIIDQNGNIISTGYHQKYGENHAERNAIINAGNKDLKDATLFVNLEPCSHYGKTPPCADLIIEKGIKRVIIGMRDVNPIVAGNGIKKLKNAGIEVIEGILEKECRQLNEIFIKNMEEQKTYVALKTATTLDGKIATASGSSKWITSAPAREEVKLIRNRYDAILTSCGTVIADDPTMEHRQKIVLDRNLKTDFIGAKIYQSHNVTVFYDEKLTPPDINNVKFIPAPVLNNQLDIKYILKKMYELGIKSVLIEAGGKLNGSFLEYVDKIYQFVAPKIIGDNNALSCYNYRSVADISEAKNFKILNVRIFSPDILITLQR